ncbi:MAG: YegS/Rv2252/BmrU family lipid kinase [Pseudomonadota bacterium]
MKSDEWFFVVNPEAAGGRCGKKWPELRQVLEKTELVFSCAITEHAWQVYAVVDNAVKTGYRKFTVVGGDGSLNEAVNAFMRQEHCDPSELILNIVPWGTGNDWAHYHGIKADIASCVDTFNNYSLVEQDLGRVTYFRDGVERTHWFLNFVGTGIASHIALKISEGRGSRLSYYLATFKSIFSYRSPIFHLFAGDQNIASQCMMLMACNGKYAGAGMLLAPDAKTDDGLLNVLLVEEIPLIKRIPRFIALLMGKVNEQGNVTTVETESLSINANMPIAFQCDGELIGSLPINVRCEYKRITVAMGV